jgi:hypothetical protein
MTMQPGVAMDASQLPLTFAIAVVAVGATRVVMSSLGRAGDGIATLFVPPDRTLPWPRGVQEGDEPWGWRGAAPTGAAPPVDPGAGEDDQGTGVDRDVAWTEPLDGPFVVPLGPVDPVQVGVRPH